MQPRKTALIFGITANLSFALANTLLGIKEHSPALLKHVIVYHDGIPPEVQGALNEICSCDFRLYAFPDDLSRIEDRLMQRYSPLMFARYEGFRLLAEEGYDAFLWSDVDVLFVGDVSEVFQEIAGTGLGMTLSTAPEFNLGSNFRKPLPGLDSESFFYNSGFLVATRRIPDPAGICRWLYEATVRYAEYLEWPDQAILNLMVRDLGLPITQLPAGRYFHHPYTALTDAIYRGQSSTDDVAVLHSYGAEKFWSSPAYYMGFSPWRDYHKQWSKLLLKHVSLEEPPVISVLFPTLNSEEYVYEAVDSILTQTFYDFELLVLDGGSTDKTLAIVASFDDPRVRIITDDTPNGNLATSLNLGLAAARGQYIARMDADDIALPIRFEKQIRFMQTHPEISLCGTGAYTFGSSYTKLWPSLDPKASACSLILCTPFVHPSVLWRKADFDAHGLAYDPGFATNEDFELWQRASEVVNLCAIDDDLMLYRMHDNKGTLRAAEANKISQGLIINRFFTRYARPLSQEALLLFDQRDNTGTMSRKAVTRGFKDFCSAALQLSGKDLYLDRKALTRSLDATIGWIFQTRVDKFYTCGFTALFTRSRLSLRGGLWKERLRSLFSRKRAAGKKSRYLQYLNPGILAHAIAFQPLRTTVKCARLCKRILRKKWDRLRNNVHCDCEALLLEKVMALSADLKVGGIQATRAAFAEYRAERDQKALPVCLQFAADRNYLPGWFSTDINSSPGLGIHYQDLSQVFPYPSSSAHYIFMEHSIEHFPTDMVLHILRESHRVLQPGGVIRLATPDLRQLIDFYLRDSDLHDRYRDFQTDTNLMSLAQLGVYSKALVLNNFYRDWGHATIFDQQSLSALLAASGFSKVTRVEIGQSEYPSLQGVERHGGFDLSPLSDEFNRLETMVLEAVK